jgi:hypothetical protein
LVILEEHLEPLEQQMVELVVLDFQVLEEEERLLEP